MITWLRGAFSLLLAVGILAVALPVAFGSVGDGQGDPLRVFSSGSLIAPQVGGASTLSVSGLVPGQSRSATIRVANPGDGKVALDLAAQISDHPAAGGVRLSEALIVRIESSDGSTVYAGSLGRMPSLQLGGLAAGARRSYRFTVSLAAGAGNEVEGASLGARFAWSAA